MSDDVENILNLHDEDVRMKKVELLFQEWNLRLHKGALAHNRMAIKLEHRDRLWSGVNLIFAITVLFLGAAKGLTVVYDQATSIEGFLFTTLVTVSNASTVLAPIFSLFVVLTAAYQYVSQFSARAARHGKTAIEYANLRRKMERYWTKRKLHEEALHSISRSYNTIARFAPLVPVADWDQIHELSETQARRLNEEYFTL